MSEAFEKQQERPELELIVTVYNINWGQNPELMEACRLLKEYAKYVEQVRNYAKEMPFPEAVEHAVDACIKEGILAEFLSKNRAEAIAMSIFEYDEEKHMKSEREWAYKNGHEDGHREGRKEGEKTGLKKGEQRLVQLLQSLMDKGQGDEVSRVLSDSAYREQLYQEHDL